MPLLCPYYAYIMPILCPYYATIIPLLGPYYIPLMPLLLFYYASIMPVLCPYYSPIFPLLFLYYYSIMPLLCPYYSPLFFLYYATILYVTYTLDFSSCRRNISSTVLVSHRHAQYFRKCSWQIVGLEASRVSEAGCTAIPKASS